MAPAALPLGRSFHNSAFALKRIVEVVPALGESITEGSIARWEKKEGDSVSPDDVVVVIETDKVSVDIKANYKGIITKLLASESVRIISYYYLSLIQHSLLISLLRWQWGRPCTRWNPPKKEHNLLNPHLQQLLQ